MRSGCLYSTKIRKIIIKLDDQPIYLMFSVFGSNFGVSDQRLVDAVPMSPKLCLSDRFYINGLPYAIGAR